MYVNREITLTRYSCGVWLWANNVRNVVSLQIHVHNILQLQLVSQLLHVPHMYMYTLIDHDTCTCIHVPGWFTLTALHVTTSSTHYCRKHVGNRQCVYTVEPHCYGPVENVPISEVSSFQGKFCTQVYLTGPQDSVSIKQV